jgi:hypothetical protein|tara:strand:+ start:733 stop:1659 length:927 start_codon:yes stop_codon:yes gene_type:complete
MKYIKLFEKFTKEYQTKIDLKDFKKIKKGSMIQYMGGPVEVLDNNGYVLKLKGKDGKTFTVNKSQFDHGGRIAEEEGTLTEGELHGESVNESTKPYKKGQRVDYQLTHKGGVGKFADATSKSKNIESGVIKKRTKGLGGTFKYELTSGLELYGSEIVGLTEGTYNSKDHIGSTSDGQGANAEIYKKGKGYYVVVSGEVDYDFTAKNDKELLKKLEDAEFDSTDIVESSSTDGGDKSNGNSHHDDHQTKSIAQHWKDIYGEEFHTKYPAIAKILKSRPGIDKRELKRIWDETYGENFEEQYPALWQKID